MKPPMRLRPVYVVPRPYVYRRMCRRNPSYERFEGLPVLERDMLWDNYAERRRKKLKTRGKVR